MNPAEIAKEKGGTEHVICTTHEPCDKVSVSAFVLVDLSSKEVPIVHTDHATE